MQIDPLGFWSESYELIILLGVRGLVQVWKKLFFFPLVITETSKQDLMMLGWVFQTQRCQQHPSHQESVQLKEDLILIPDQERVQLKEDLILMPDIIVKNLKVNLYMTLTDCF